MKYRVPSVAGALIGPPRPQAEHANPFIAHLLTTTTTGQAQDQVRQVDTMPILSSTHALIHHACIILILPHSVEVVRRCAQTVRALLLTYGLYKWLMSTTGSLATGQGTR